MGEYPKDESSSHGDWIRGHLEAHAEVALLLFSHTELIPILRLAVNIAQYFHPSPAFVGTKNRTQVCLTVLRATTEL